jgi:hypothetical protein
MHVCKPDTDALASRASTLRLCAATVVVCLFLSLPTAFSHPGGLDKNGCHVDRKTGEEMGPLPISLRVASGCLEMSGQIMQHLELTSPVGLEAWQEVLRGADSATVFQDHARTFHGPRHFNITNELKQLIDDFGAQSLTAIFSVRNGMVEGVWIDPLHNYIATVFSKATGDDEDAVLINSLASG